MTTFSRKHDIFADVLYAKNPKKVLMLLIRQIQN